MNSELSRTEITLIGNLLMCAIAKLDESGRDEKVSQAMSIIYTVIQAEIRGVRLSIKEAYDIGMKKALQH